VAPPATRIVKRYLSDVVDNPRAVNDSGLAASSYL